MRDSEIDRIHMENWRARFEREPRQSRRALYALATVAAVVIGALCGLLAAVD